MNSLNKSCITQALLQTFSDCSGSVQEALLTAQSKVNQACSNPHIYSHISLSSLTLSWTTGIGKSGNNKPNSDLHSL